MLPPFKNEPLTDFSQPDRADAYRQALAEVRQRLGSHRPLIIGGRTVDTETSLAQSQPVSAVGSGGYRGHRVHPARRPGPGRGLEGLPGVGGG